MDTPASSPPAPYAAPPRPRNARGELRKVGLELELGRLSLEQTLEIIRAGLGGNVALESRTEGSVHDTPFGTFHVEFDHSILKTRSYLRPLERLGLIDDEDSPGAQRVESAVLHVAAEIVPIEVVTPPVPWDRLHELDPLWRALRHAHAADTHGSLLYAFGLHLNPEVPDGEAPTLLAFLRAFLLLEDWLVAASRIDVSRKISPFIRSFPESYRRKVLAPAYAPSALQFVDDYLEHNPTRNRPLDLCPLFAHLHGGQIVARVEEAHLVKGRPTFHYRLPNCELAQAGWTPARDWNRWLLVERLANDPTLLAALSRAYMETLDLPLRMQSSGWLETLEARLSTTDLTLSNT
jgi:hypothetical protein